MSEIFKVEVSDQDSGVEVRFFGELTIDAEEAMAGAFRSVDLSRRPPIVVDFARVPYVNSSGIAALLGVLMGLSEKTVGIRFTGLNRHLEKIFRMTGLPSLVTM